MCGKSYFVRLFRQVKKETFENESISLGELGKYCEYQAVQEKPKC